jgi:hypothetical protein
LTFSSVDLRSSRRNDDSPTTVGIVKLVNPLQVSEVSDEGSGLASLRSRSGVGTKSVDEISSSCICESDERAETTDHEFMRGVRRARRVRFDRRLQVTPASKLGPLGTAATDSCKSTSFVSEFNGGLEPSD